MTGTGNKVILEMHGSLHRNSKAGWFFRMPVIPGYNDYDEHIRQLSGF